LRSLTYDKVEPALSIKEVDLNQVVEKVSRSYQLEVESMKGELKLSLDGGLPVLLTDEVHLTNIIDNLLDNAVKYSGWAPQIKIITKAEGKYHEVIVKDSGIGMNKEQQDHIFEKFYRASNGNLHNVKGFGLGLSYVKWALEMLNGKIEVISKPKQGTKVIICIPNTQNSNER